MENVVFCGCAGVKLLNKEILRQREKERDFYAALQPLLSPGTQVQSSTSVLLFLPCALALSLTQTHTHSEGNHSCADLLIKHAYTSIFHNHFARRYCTFGLTGFFWALIWIKLDILAFLILSEQILLSALVLLPLFVNCLP